MPKCKYCDQPFDESSDWRKKNPGLGGYCSHGCLYAGELPNSHGGQTFVSLEPIGQTIPETVQLQDVVPGDEHEQQALVEAERRFSSVIELLAGMKAGDRDLLLYRIHNRNRTLASYAVRMGVTTQAAHRRLVKICKKHPCVEWAISEHRYRKRT